MSERAAFGVGFGFGVGCWVPCRRSVRRGFFWVGVTKGKERKGKERKGGRRREIASPWTGVNRAAAAATGGEGGGGDGVCPAAAAGVVGRID